MVKIIFKKKEKSLIISMGQPIFNIIIVLILIASFATINYAYAEINVTLTPDDFVFKNLSLIIDINATNPETQDPITIIIQVVSSAGNEDRETFNVE